MGQEEQRLRVVEAVSRALSVNPCNNGPSNTAYAIISVAEEVLHWINTGRRKS